MSNSNSLLWSVKTFEDLSKEELYKIIQARINVFVVEQNSPYPDLDNEDQKAIHLWCESGGKIMAYCRIFGEGIKYNECSLGRVLTTEEARGKKVGRSLMTIALQIIESRFRTKEVRISAQDYLLDFYKSFGFKDTGKKYLEDNIPHTEMYRF